MRARNERGALLTELIDNLARARPLVEKLGQDLAAPAGLSAAGWHVASALGTDRATVPEIARRLGRKRQSVQAAVDDLLESGHAHKLENPAHARSPLIMLTTDGVDAFWATLESQVEVLNEMASGLTTEDLRTTVATVCAVLELLSAPTPSANT